jgi:hypothetical protein
MQPKRAYRLLKYYYQTERNLQVCLFGFQYVHTCKKTPNYTGSHIEGFPFD